MHVPGAIRVPRWPPDLWGRNTNLEMLRGRHYCVDRNGPEDSFAIWPTEGWFFDCVARVGESDTEMTGYSGRRRRCRDERYCVELFVVLSSSVNIFDDCTSRGPECIDVLRCSLMVYRYLFECFRYFIITFSPLPYIHMNPEHQKSNALLHCRFYMLPNSFHLIFISLQYFYLWIILMFMFNYQTCDYFLKHCLYRKFNEFEEKHSISFEALKTREGSECFVILPWAMDENRNAPTRRRPWRPVFYRMRNKHISTFADGCIHNKRMPACMDTAK